MRSAWIGIEVTMGVVMGACDAMGVAGLVGVLQAAGLKGFSVIEPAEGAGTGGVTFYCDGPPTDFAGMKGTKLFGVDLLLDECDDHDACLIERCGGYVVATQARVLVRETTGVSGRALECAEGSPEERAFMSYALDEFAEDAAGPLMSLKSAAVDGGLKLSKSQGDALIAAIRAITSTV